jgi:hypothetical protein
MRMFVLKQGQDLQSVLTRAGGAAAGAASLDQLKRLNPHVDFAKLQPGTVLLLPGAGSTQADANDAVAGAVFDSLADDVKNGLKAATERVRAGAVRAGEQRKELSAAFSSSAFRKAAEGDAELRGQADGAQARFKTEQGRAKETDGQLKALEKVLDTDLAVLERLLRGS